MSPHALHAAMDAATLTAASYAAYRYLPFVRLMFQSRHTTITAPLWLNAGVGLTASSFVFYRAYWLLWRLLPPDRITTPIAQCLGWRLHINRQSATLDMVAVLGREAELPHAHPVRQTRKP